MHSFWNILPNLCVFSHRTRIPEHNKNGSFPSTLAAQCEGSTSTGVDPIQVQDTAGPATCPTSPPPPRPPSPPAPRPAARRCGCARGRPEEAPCARRRSRGRRRSTSCWVSRRKGAASRTCGRRTAGWRASTTRTSPRPTPPRSTPDASSRSRRHTRRSPTPAAAAATTGRSHAGSAGSPSTRPRAATPPIPPSTIRRWKRSPDGGHLGKAKSRS